MDAFIHKFILTLKPLYTNDNVGMVTNAKIMKICSGKTLLSAEENNSVRNFFY